VSGAISLLQINGVHKDNFIFTLWCIVCLYYKFYFICYLSLRLLMLEVLEKE
jgi:hypothetical protein